MGQRLVGWGCTGVVGLAAALVVSACGVDSEHGGAGRPREGVDGLQLALQPVSGITLSSLHYVVTRAGAAPIVAEGNLPLPGTGRTLSFGVPLPVGSAYTLQLSAESAELNDDITCTGSFGPFDVHPNDSTHASLTLVCVDNTNGQIVGGVGVETDACPRLVVDYALVEPGSQNIGGAVQVRGAARDLDAPSAILQYNWAVASAANGSPRSPSAATASWSRAKSAISSPLTPRRALHRAMRRPASCARRCAGTVS